MNDDASELLGEPVEAGIWVQTVKPRWYEDLPGTATEFDLLILAFLLPFVAYSHFFSDRKAGGRMVMGHAGLIYSALTGTEFVFIGASSGFKQAKLTRILGRFPRTDWQACDFKHTHTTPVTFRFTDNRELLLYFKGVWSDLAEFRGAVKGISGAALHEHP